MERSHKASLSVVKDIIWPFSGAHDNKLMLYVRSNPHDYDHWEQLGNPTWNWANVVKYFERMEKFSVSTSHEKDTNHGYNGPLNVDWLQYEDAFKQVLFDATDELGHKRILDINGNDQIGIGVAPAVMDQGVPMNPAKAYLSQTKGRQNLHVIRNAYAMKVNIDNSTGQATGVDFIINNVTKATVNVTREVILTAGSVGTPHLLQLSGIWAEKYIRRLNMSMIRDLKVGYSLQDHIYVPIFWQYNSSKSVAATSADSIDTLFQYVKGGRGSPSTNRIFDVIGFFNTVNVTDSHPNVGTQFMTFKRGEIGAVTDYLEKFGLNTTVTHPVVSAISGADIAIAFITLLNPRAMGKIRLNSTDPKIAPRIKPNYLDHREDVVTLVQGIQLLRTFYQTASFMVNEVTEINMGLADCAHSRPKKVKVKPEKAARPTKSTKPIQDEQLLLESVANTTTEETIAYGSDPYWECYVRHFAMSMDHAVGTAKMGPVTDPFAVVDSRLLVHGLKGLRVIDASVMPSIVSGNVKTAEVMIAEKGSDFVKEDWTSQSNIEPNNEHVEL